ncbi:glutaredoxin [Vibrio sp. SM6]|uniref:Glutaredoxin n=1 Tax=Vibrio agarilyticus TaxID=2726741 RepID=A0A7X8TNY5_9VIBR|nr:glutaredoxin [Vibrio agarilyticus]NLS12109.1 glutaredoxin [Vibrio agarilyticus]
MTQPIKLTLYRWAGSWGPFKVNIPCGECTLTKDIIKDVLVNELAGIPVEVEIKDWLSHWWEPLKHGAWHAPIVKVGDKIVSQGEALNRGVLVQKIIEQWTKQDNLKGNIVFGKAGCPHCVRAKSLLDKVGISYQYHDVVKESSALYRMIPEVKAHIGLKTPVTVPQIWLEGSYIGGADALEKWLETHLPETATNNVVNLK